MAYSNERPAPFATASTLNGFTTQARARRFAGQKLAAGTPVDPTWIGAARGSFDEALDARAAAAAEPAGTAVDIDVASRGGGRGDALPAGAVGDDQPRPALDEPP